MSTRRYYYHKECNGCAFMKELARHGSDPCMLREEDYCPCRNCLVKLMGDSSCSCDNYEETAMQYNEKYKGKET